MEKETKNVLNDVVETIEENPISFDITIAPQTAFHKWLQKLKLKPVKKSFVLKPVVMGNMLRISKLALSINPDELKRDHGFADVAYQLIGQHSETLLEIIAIAIQNNRQKPSAALIKLLRENLSAAEVSKLISMVLMKLDLKNFIISIISTRGLNILETGEKKTSENEVSPSNQGS